MNVRRRAGEGEIALGTTHPPLPYPRLSLRPADQQHHATIWGRTGSGKSKLLQSLFLQHLAQGHGVGLIEPHHDLSFDTLSSLVARGFFRDEAAYERLVYLDWGNGSYVPFNVLAGTGDPHSRALNALEAMLRVWPELTQAPAFQTLFLAAMLTLIANGLPITALYQLLSDQPFRKMCLAKMGTAIAGIWRALTLNADRRLASFAILLETLNTILGLIGQRVSEPGVLLARDVTFLLTLLLLLFFFAVSYVRSDEESRRLRQQLEDHRDQWQQRQEAQQRRFEEESRRLRQQLQNQEEQSQQRQEEEQRRFEDMHEAYDRLLASELHHAYDLVRRHKEQLFGHYYRSGEDSELPILKAEEKQLLQQLCDSVAFTVKREFHDYWTSKGFTVQNDISVSMKQVVPYITVLTLFHDELTEGDRITMRRVNPTNIWIITTFREHDTRMLHPDREVGGNLFSGLGNTVFRKLILGRELAFFNNNLIHYQDFNNQNADWNTYYNATLAVPIRYWLDTKEKKIYRCYGVLAVDSQNSQGLELYDERGASILRHAAELLATFFLLVELAGSPPENAVQ